MQAVDLSFRIPGPLPSVSPFFRIPLSVFGRKGPVGAGIAGSGPLSDTVHLRGDHAFFQPCKPPFLNAARNFLTPARSVRVSYVHGSQSLPQQAPFHGSTFVHRHLLSFFVPSRLSEDAWRGHQPLPPPHPDSPFSRYNETAATSLHSSISLPARSFL